MDFDSIYPGFESQESNEIFLIYFFNFFYAFFFHYYYSENLQIQLRFSYFITPYDAQAHSAFSVFFYSFMLITCSSVKFPSA